jgi:hypothetical protein
LFSPLGRAAGNAARLNLKGENMIATAQINDAILKNGESREWTLIKKTETQTETLLEKGIRTDD